MREPEWEKKREQRMHIRRGGFFRGMLMVLGGAAGLIILFYLYLMLTR